VQAGQREIGPVGHPQDELVFYQATEPSGQQRAIAGHDHADPGGQPITDQPLQFAEQPPAVDVLQGGQERVVPVHKHQQEGRSAVRGLGSTVFRQVAVPVRGQHPGARAELGGQPAEQALHPVGLCRRHDRAAVRERGQRHQRAAAVQHVQVCLIRIDLGRQAASQGAQHGAAARLRRTRDQQVTAAGDIEDGRDLTLFVWPVGQPVAEPQRVLASPRPGGELGRRQGSRQRRRPWRPLA
jgi:hypothetical protein